MGGRQATIRCYAELNDFLSRDRRQRDIEYRFDATPSVKDAIESLGVPHTEVDLILVEGVSVGFGHRLADGERVSVYPVFERFDIGNITLVRPEPLRQVRFVADVHLGKLARRLRLLGFDTLYDTGWFDEDLGEISVSDRRVLLTRDRGLLKRRAITHGLYVRSDEPDEQAIDVIRRLHLAGRIQPLSRCPRCNELLEDRSKDEIADLLSPMTRERVNRFKICPGCDQLYWRGAHHGRIHDMVERVRREL
jgi:uncharacterized protein with PIN domain